MSRRHPIRRSFDGGCATARLGIAALASALIVLVSAGAFVVGDLGREQQQIVAAPGAARLPADPAPDRLADRVLPRI